MLGLTLTFTQLSTLIQGCGAAWIKYCLLHNVTENNTKKGTGTRKKKSENRCRNCVPKSTQRKKDNNNYTNPYICSPTSLLLYYFVQRCRDGWCFVYLPSLLSFLVCVLFGTPILLYFFLSSSIWNTVKYVHTSIVTLQSVLAVRNIRHKCQMTLKLYEQSRIPTCS